MANNKNPQTRVTTVLQRMTELVEADPRFADMFAPELNRLLNGVKSSDGFGLHGELDPRGDARLGQFSLDHVAGVDDDCPHGTPTTEDCELRIQHGVCSGCGRQTIYPR
ncbi:hypothetical protein C9I98_16545 [Photobacterium sanctipauli]|uniref:Uncharacterized protein n=1 Tax=Photobacterium sanctipauli TaxID=1342794 RepID=A0A2T3NPZ2_9GAMM|nr:hypothetical protein [Photobacterium sanctipauli]PSW18311.1 hypothetical protein C9I98_16545 [Photobacterium sanctipauli]